MVSFRRSGTAVAEAPEAAQATAPVVHALPSSAAAFPRVNLMPEVIAAEAKVRSAKTVLVGAAALSVLAVGGLYLMATNDVNAAQERLDTAAGQGVVLQKELQKYADVPKVQNDVAVAQTQLYNAMGGEVRWSFLLNNLALTIPSNTSLKSFTGVVNGLPPQPAAAAGTAAAPDDNAIVSPLGNAGIGQISYEGEAMKFSDFANFLDGQAKQKTLLDPYPGEVKRSTDYPKGYTFQSTVTVTDKALSHRYDMKAGN